MAKQPKKKVGITAKEGKQRAVRTAIKRRIEKSVVELLPQAPVADAPAVSDFEDLLINSLLNDRTGGIYKGISGIDMIFDLTHAGRELGYNAGFLVGNSLYQKSNSRIEVLFKALEMFGLGKVLYYPSTESVIITANEQRRGHLELHNNIHVYEAGLIAGFLSGATGQKISVEEAYCIYNDSEFCQFIADAEQKNVKKWDNIPQDTVIRTIAHIIRGEPVGVIGSQTEHEYYVLPILPLTKKPLAGETAKVLYNVGVNLAQITKNEDPGETLQRIAYYFDLKGVSIEKGRESKRVIRLKYKHYNSLDQLVKLTASLFVGFLTTALDSKPELEMSNDSDKSYVVKIKIKWAD